MYPTFAFTLTLLFLAEFGEAGLIVYFWGSIGSKASNGEVQIAVTGKIRRMWVINLMAYIDSHIYKIPNWS